MPHVDQICHPKALLKTTSNIPNITLSYTQLTVNNYTRFLSKFLQKNEISSSPFHLVLNTSISRYVGIFQTLDKCLSGYAISFQNQYDLWNNNICNSIFFVFNFRGGKKKETQKTRRLCGIKQALYKYINWRGFSIYKFIQRFFLLFLFA